MTNKAERRKEYQTIRNNLSDQERLHQERMVLELLKNFPPYAQAKKIAVYLSFQSEFSTHTIIQHALTSGKICYAPVITDRDHGQMIFRPINSKGDQADQPIDFDCMLIPLVAFDKNHFRIGMGGGFYDRYLSLHKSKKTFLLGLAYLEQYCENLPHDNWDKPLNAVVTANGFF